MKAFDEKPWFSPKLYGFGTGFPVSWEGWLVLAVFLVGTIAVARYVTGWERIAGLGAMILGLGLICAAKTDGGWRWRSGRRDD